MKHLTTLHMPAMTPGSIRFVRDVEQRARKVEQVRIATDHVLHGGIYTRTICVPAGVMITGALIKIPTTLTISGHCAMLVGDVERVDIEGFMVMAAPANRKALFIAHSDTYISMSFVTEARSVEQAEEEFTDETDLLKSRDGINTVEITEA